MPQGFASVIRLLPSLESLAQVGQAGLQTGCAVIKQHLNRSVAYAEAVWVADRRGEQAQALVHRQGRVDACLADVGQGTGGCGLEHKG